MPYETSARKATRQFSTSFLYGMSMDDTGINEEMSFVLDRVPVMEQNSDEYRAESAKNEVKVEFMTQSSQIFTNDIHAIDCRFSFFSYNFVQI